MPSAIVLPGMDGTGALLDDFASALSEHFDVRVIPYPADEPLRYPQLCAFARERLPPGDFILVAESFSGPVALQLAAEQPPGLRALVLCASFARVDLPGKWFLSRCAAIVPLRFVPTAFLSLLLWGRWRTRERTRSLAHALAQVSPDVLRTRAGEALDVDLTHAPSLRVPVLYLQAMRDRVIGASASRALQAVAVDMHVQRFDAPHFLLQVRARECADAIATFVRNLRSDR